MTTVCNIILLGDTGVGKTCFVTRLLKGYFTESYITTLGAEYLQYEYNDTIINIFDTAGQERYEALCSSYYRKANGVILVYDVMDSNSLKNVSKWIEKVNRFVEDIPIIICANKIDLLEEEYTPPSNIQMNHSCIKISCKTGENIDKILPMLMPNVNTIEITSSTIEALWSYVPCYML